MGCVAEVIIIIGRYILILYRVNRMWGELMVGDKEGGKVKLKHVNTG